jgi:site-specific DNA recombinase
MLAFIYCRVSTVEQSREDHYSLDNQEQRGRDYLKMKRWQLFKVRKDVASGKNSDRPGFQELLADIRAKRVDVVVVYRLDRLSRNVKDIYEFLDLIRTSGVAFVSVTEGFDTTTAMGRAMLGVAAVFAQLTREMIAENTRDGLMRRAEAGYFNGNPTSFYGYDYDREQMLLVPNPEKAAVVRQIFTWFVEHKWGQVRICRVLNLQGIPSKMGGEWHQATVADMLRNPVYCGRVRVNGTVAEGRHEAIIAPEVFDEAQELIKSRAPMPPRTQHSKHLLSGIARCGTCGTCLKAHYIAASPKGSTKTYDYRLYGHSANARVGAKSCRGFAKSADRLEAVIVDQIRQASQDGWIEQVVLEDVRKRQNGKVPPMLRERDQLLAELAELGDKFSQWADRLDSGRIDEDQFEQQNRRLLARKQEIQKRLSALDEQLGQEEHLEVTLAEIRSVLADFPIVWEALTLEERRETLRLLVEHLTVYKTHAELKILFLYPVVIPLDFRGSRAAPAKSKVDAAAA